MKLLLVFLTCFLMQTCFTNKKENKKILLGSLLPVDSISSIKVSNFSGTHVLTSKELITLKEQLKQAVYSGGLLVKPGHIRLEIIFSNNTSEFPSATTGSIHFESGIDEKGIDGTFFLPQKINFDNYR